MSVGIRIDLNLLLIASEVTKLS